MTVHSPAWFAKQEARLQEPIKNTVRYLGKSAIIKIFAGLPTLILPVIGIIELYKHHRHYEQRQSRYERRTARNGQDVHGLERCVYACDRTMAQTKKRL